MAVWVVAGEIGAKTVTTRTIVPTLAQPHWPPFERVAETIATPNRRFPPHRHEGVEVLTYVVEGAGLHEYGSAPAEPLVQGSAAILTAPTGVSHTVTPGKGQTVRWFAVVATLPAGSAAEPRFQSRRTDPADVQADGTAVRRLVGPGSPLRSAVGLESEVIEFRSAGASFRRVGHDRRAIVYALAGRGTIDNQPLDGGEAAFVEDAGSIALQGHPGFEVVLVSAPRPPA